MAEAGSVLLLADDDAGHANTIHDQLTALRSSSRHRVQLFNPRGVRTPPSLGLDDFDAIVIHWSLVIISDNYLHPTVIESLRRYTGPKILMIQDDYRWVNRMTAAMRSLRIDVLFTLVPAREIPKIWPESALPGVRKITYLAGYVPEHLLGRTVPPLAERPLDLVYRGRELPFWLGRLSQEKTLIAVGVQARAAAHSLKVDLAFREGERIYGDDWINFICSARGTLGTESGSTITDFDGTVEKAVHEHRARHPDATFEEVHAAVLAPFEGNVRMNVISPRIFEAAALRTALVLFPGEYSDVLTPNRHYLPLEKDFSNLTWVAEQIGDTNRLEEMVQRTYGEIACSGRYSLKSFVSQVDDAIEGIPRFAPRGRYPYRLQLRRAERIMGRRIGSLLTQYVFRSLLGAFAIVENPVLAPLLARAVLTGRLPLTLLPRLGADLIRFRLVRDAAGGRVGSGAPFYLTLNLEGVGKAMLVSRPGSPQPLALDNPRDLENVSLTWNHSLVGSRVPLAWRFPGETIGVGQEGTHHFEALSLVGPEPGRIIARAAVRGRAGGSFSFRDVLSKASVYAPRVSAALRETLRSNAGRSLLWVWASRRDLRHSIGINYLLGDILKLRALGLALRKNAGFTIEASAQGHEVRYRSIAGSIEVMPGPGPRGASRISWDHRAIGPLLNLERVTGDRVNLVMGVDGVHTFTALQVVGQRYPDLLARVLREFLG